MPAGEEKIELLKLVPAPLRADVSRRLRVTRAPKGRMLVEKGSRSRDVFFMIEGEALVVLYSANGREVSLNNIGAGEMFGEIAAVDAGTRSASVVALCNVIVAVMGVSDFEKCTISSPGACLWLARRLVSTIRLLTDRVFELSALNVQGRIYCELLRLAQNAEARNGAIELRPAPTHEELANRVGTHREAVTRELRALSKMGVIRSGRRRLTIMDTAVLAQRLAGL